jgi:hypothetical protein
LSTKEEAAGIALRRRMKSRRKIKSIGQQQTPITGDVPA